MRSVLVVIAAVLAACQTAPTSSSPAASSPPPSAAGSTAPARPAASAAPQPEITSVTVADVHSAALTPQPSAVRFADAMHGWVGVSDGLLGTSDGGATWTRELSSERIRRIRAFDATHAWAFAADDTVYRTADGRSWSRIPATTPRMVDMQFVTPLIGWAIAAPPPADGQAPSTITSTLLHSTDGGVIWYTWSSQSIQSVCFTDERNGWGADHETALRTSDGGRTWRRIFEASVDIGTDRWSADIVCSDLTNAWVQMTCGCVGLSHSGYLVYATHDGGRAWKLEYLEHYTLGSRADPSFTASGLGSYPSIMAARPGGGASFITCTPPASSQRIVLRDAFGEHGFSFAGNCALDGQLLDERTAAVITYDSERAWLLLTRDAGATWTPLYPAAGPPLSRFARAGASLVGYTRIGDAGGVYSSTDDGRTWVRIGELPTPSEYYPYYDFSSISFTDATHGWIAAMDHSLYATTDGGRTWTKNTSPSLPPNAVARVEFVDAMHGWVMSDGLMRTNDGGATWQKVHDVAAHSDLACAQAGCWVYLKDGVLAFVRDDGSATPLAVPELTSEAATLRLHAEADRPTVIAIWWPFDACHDFGLHSCARMVTRAGDAWSEIRIPIATDWPGDVWWTSATTAWLRTAGLLYRSDDAGRTWSEIAPG